MHHQKRQSNFAHNTFFIMATHKLVISDESVNTYGTRFITKGIDLSAYKKNPIVLWMHKRDDNWRKTGDVPLPIGKCIKLTVENGQLIGEFEFDANDDFAVKIEQKIAGGYINACSPGLAPIEVSDSPDLILAGQRYGTVTKSKLVEVSIVDIPSNQNAVRLYSDGGELINLSDSDLSKLFQNISTIKTKEDGMKNLPLFVALLAAGALTNEDDLYNEVVKLKNERDDLKSQLESGRITVLVDSAIKDGKITEAEKDSFKKLAAADFDSVKSVLDTMKPKTPGTQVVKLSEAIQRVGGTGAANVATKKSETEYYKLSKANPTELARIKEQEPERFKEMMSEYTMLKA